MEEPIIGNYEPLPAPYYARWRRRFFILLAVFVLVPLFVIVYALVRFGSDRPVVYDTPEEHFKYGSTGGERESGFPY